jgi:hypothetical protein
MEKMILGTNYKLSKRCGAAANYRITGLTMAPGSISGHEVCPWRGFCFMSCVLHYAGRRVQNGPRQKALRITRMFFENHKEFMRQLDKEISAHVRNANRDNLIPLIRLNTASDLNWNATIRRHHDCRFHDYTKSARRFRQYLDGMLPPNYDLVFSVTERSTDAQLKRYLDRGGNIAMVRNIEYIPALHRSGPIPDYVEIAGSRYPTFDADLHDVRLPEIDGHGKVGILRLKGTNAAKRNAIKSGFARGAFVPSEALAGVA